MVCSSQQLGGETFVQEASFKPAPPTASVPENSSMAGNQQQPNTHTHNIFQSMFLLEIQYTEQRVFQHYRRFCWVYVKLAAYEEDS